MIMEYEKWIKKFKKVADFDREVLLNPCLSFKWRIKILFCSITAENPVKN